MIITFSSLFFSFYSFKLIFEIPGNGGGKVPDGGAGEPGDGGGEHLLQPGGKISNMFDFTKSFHKYLYKYRRNYSSTGMYIVIKSHFRGSLLNWEHFWSFQFAIANIIAAFNTSNSVVKCSSH